MNINRHNYEEYFILYLDNELSDAERSMVETFVQHNPDLKDELDILLQSRLLPDNNIVFDNKEELMKAADDPAIHLSNYEEWLTLYVDDELSLEQKKQVEKFIALYPKVQQEISLLQKAKLQPEEIVFPYKESLYRRTEKVRVIQMNWRKIAVAVVLLLALSTTVILIFNKNKQPESRLANNPSNKGIKAETKNTAVTNPTTKNEATQPESKGPDKPNHLNELKLANDHIRFEKSLPENKNDKKDEPIIANHNNDDKPSNHLPQEPIYNSNPKKNLNNNDAVATIGSNSSSTMLMIDVTKPLAAPSDNGLIFVKNQENNSSDLEEGGNKSSRGFFRKAVRFIEKRTGIKPANDDNKVLIGSLAVKL